MVLLETVCSATTTFQAEIDFVAGAISTVFIDFEFLGSQT